MPRKARARLLWPEISTSERVNDLPLDAALLYTWMIAHADDQGRMLGSTRVIKAVVAPLQDELDESTIGVSLAVMENEGLIRLYKAGGREILQLLDWWEYQYPLRQPRPSKYPPPPGWRDRTSQSRDGLGKFGREED